MIKTKIIIGIIIAITLLGMVIYFALMSSEKIPTVEEKQIPIIEENCAKEGEQFSSVFKNKYPEHCCEGLTEWYSGMDTRISIVDACYKTNLLAGWPVGTCINCGNGICENIEDVCNCPQDCVDGQNSDYATIQEFCKTSYQQYCKNRIGEIDLALCKLCK